MPNIMVSSLCNLHCDYCFAQNTFSYDTPFIPIATFEKICRFIMTDERHIGLIGGEPTLHPEFGQIVNTALRFTDPGYIILFTNGLLLDKHIEVLKESKINIMINCNGEQILGEHKHRFLDNMALCHQELDWHKSISLSYNLYKPDQDIREFIELLDKYPVKTIRFAVASPDSSYRTMMPTDYFNIMKGKVIEFFSAVNSRKIRIVMDCNIIPNCMQNEIIRSVSHPFVDGFPKSVCRPVLDFCIDETVVRCFGLSDMRMDMNRFSSLSQLYAFFVNAIDSIAYNKPSELKCKECFERKCMGCMNGCLSFASRRATLLQ